MLRLRPVGSGGSQLVNARNNDSYTRVISPLDGVVGEIPFRVGSLVSPSSATPLTTVSDNSEMYVYFSMTERQILELVAQYGAENFLQKLPTVSLKLSMVVYTVERTNRNGQWNYRYTDRLLEYACYF